MKTRLTAYIEYAPVYGYEIMRDTIINKITEIIECQKDIVIPLDFFELVVPSISSLSLSELPPDHELVLAIRNNKYPLPISKKVENFLVISIEVTVPLKVHDTFIEMMKEIDEHFFDNLDLVEMNKTLIYTQFEKRVYDLIIAANLSTPASLQISSGIITQDISNIGSLRNLSCASMFHAMQFNKRIGYPTMRELPLSTVWKWVLERRDFLTGFSEGKTGRALICFSYILNSSRLNDDASVLFRSIMGIEALYTKGTGNLQEQVKEKSQSILGIQDSHKKVYSSMYNFRSRFVHGDLDFPNQYNIDYTSKSTTYNQEFEQAKYYSITLLTASLQELIFRNWGGFHFQYLASDSKER